MCTENFDERVEKFYDNLINLVNEKKLDEKIDYIVSPDIQNGEVLGEIILKLDTLITSKPFFKKWLYRNIRTEEQLLEIEKQIFEVM